MFDETSLAILVEDFAAFSFVGGDITTASDGEIREALRAEGDFTPEAAKELLKLVRKYGSFFLRNAAALALAMDVEDGSAGF